MSQKKLQHCPHPRLTVPALQHPSAASPADVALTAGGQVRGGEREREGDVVVAFNLLNFARLRVCGHADALEP